MGGQGYCRRPCLSVAGYDCCLKFHTVLNLQSDTGSRTTVPFDIPGADVKVRLKCRHQVHKLTPVGIQEVQALQANLKLGLMLALQKPHFATRLHLQVSMPHKMTTIGCCMPD